MYNELIFTTANQKHHAFFMNGFFSASQPTSNLHKHNFAEIHMVTGGNATFRIGSELYPLNDGNIMVIPCDVFHCCIKCDEGVSHNAFQVDYKVDEIKTCSIGTSTIENLYNEIEVCRTSQDYSKIASYIALFCSQLCPVEPLSSYPVTDYGFLIREYLLLHYNSNICLSDLAKELHLSERQTERLVIKHTGNSFKEELCSIRLGIAKMLYGSTDMPLKEIAQYVGYDSYAGFWKAASRLSVSFSKNNEEALEKSHIQ